MLIAIERTLNPAGGYKHLVPDGTKSVSDGTKIRTTNEGPAVRHRWSIR